VRRSDDAALVEHRAHRVHRPVDHGGQVERRRAHQQPALRHAGHVEEVVDEARQLPGRVAGDVERAFGARRIEPRGGEAVADRGQRVAQLVPEHGEEMVLSWLACSAPARARCSAS
jgi:hypothetical protein